VLVAALLYLDRRVRFEQTPARWGPVVWCVISGVVGVGFALLFEVTLPGFFGGEVDGGWIWFVGPIEETAKLAVPVALWFAGRYRLPREGFLLVAVSAATFGVLEAGRYGLSPDDFSVARAYGEILHLLLTGFVAAVAWRAAWGRRSWLTGAAVGALAVAMALHSVNDAAALSSSKALGIVTPAVVVFLYFALKRAARQLVPPDNVASLSPHWRPVAS
jgi:hypothetical protein